MDPTSVELVTSVMRRPRLHALLTLACLVGDLDPLFEGFEAATGYAAVV